MNSRSNYFDWWLIIPSLLLIVLGLTILRSIVPQLVLFQFIFFIISIFIFLFFSVIDYRIFVSLYLPIYIGSLLFLLTPFVFGSHSHGALRWLQFGQISIQPSELVRPFLILVFCAIAVRKNIHKTLLLIGAFVLPAVVIFLQPDLGTTLILAVGWLTVFISQFSFKRFLVLSSLVCLVTLLPFWFLLKGYQKDRIMTFIDPYKDPLGRGYQVIQSIITVGSGQFLGRGLGRGTQSQLRFLPERHTDFVFASLSEELGFLGSGLSLILFSIFLWRVYKISQTAQDPLVTLFSLSFLALTAFQVFINMGMNMGLAPVTGVTLPFLSYGGSSLVSQAIFLGILNSMYRFGLNTQTSFQIR